MKFNRFFLLLALTFTLYGLPSCSNQEDGLTATEKDENTPGYYLGLRLHLNDSGATRGTDNGFTEGTDIEKAVKQLVLTFYDADGKYLSCSSIQSEDISSNLMVVSTHSSQQPAKVLAWANVDDAATILSGLSLKDAIAKTCTSGYCNAAGDFIMTSASYLDNGKIVYGTDIKQANTVLSEDDVVETTAVDVYLDRLAVKVQINKNDNIEVNLPTLNNKGVTFTLKGIALNGTNKSTYYIKNIDNYGFTTEQWQSAWNDAAKHRSYWSTDPNYLEESTNLDAYQYRTFNEIIKTDALTEYCVENTSGDKEFNIQNATHVLIVGQYKLNGVKRGTNLYLYSGQLMTAKNYKELVHLRHPFFTKSGDTYTALADSLYGIVRNGEIGKKAANVKIQLKLDANTEIYKFVDGSYTSLKVTEANKELAEEKDGIKYGQGKCYYAAPIQHLGKEGQIGQYGVVRNHYYQIAIQSINSFGEGIWNPGEDINPDEPGGDNPGGDNPGDNDGPEDPNIDPDDPTIIPGNNDPGEIIVPEKKDPILQYNVGLKVRIIKWNTISQEVDL